MYHEELAIPGFTSSSTLDLLFPEARSSKMFLYTQLFKAGRGGMWWGWALHSSYIQMVHVLSSLFSDVTLNFCLNPLLLPNFKFIQQSGKWETWYHYKTTMWYYYRKSQPSKCSHSSTPNDQVFRKWSIPPKTAQPELLPLCTLFVLRMSLKEAIWCGQLFSYILENIKIRNSENKLFLIKRKSVQPH